MESYAVVWQEGDGPRRVGKLEVDARGVHLSGGADRRRLGVFVASGTITGVDVHRPGPGPLGDMRTVTIDRAHAPPVTIGALNGIGIVFEIADVVAQLARRAMPGEVGVAVNVPIRPDRAEKVRDLLSRGPVFDPSTVPGLDRHLVFVGDSEVVFIFEGQGVYAAVERLTRNPKMWLAAAAWRDCLAGRPAILDGR
jgi:hypothetical protein